MLLGGLYGAENSAQSQTRFDRPFAPQEGFVATPERPCRDEICLNGRWKSTPPNRSSNATSPRSTNGCASPVECDHTRNWISGDGETQTDTDLPTVIGHYCNMPLMLEWKSKSKPWGVGEMGMCYAGTPAHVSVVNGDRAFESQEGRMEGLAGEAFETISMQRGLDACYASISNLAWYGVQPLEIGLDDITRPVEAEDGIWFGPYREGVPGVQPERLGPYTTTFNPGYDPRLPLYRPWTLFEGVKAAFSDTYAALPNKWAVRKHTGISEPVPAARDVVWISADPESKAERQFEELSVAFRPLDTRRNQLILLDGIRPAEDPALVERLRAALGAGSTLLVWNISPAALPLVEKLGGHAVTLTPRNAASYIIRGRHSLLNGQDLSTLYFNERTKEPVSSFVMTSGDAYAPLLDPCNTDWSKWNYQEENIKTGQVLRSERESKPLGRVLLRSEAGRGELLLSAIDPFVLGNKGSALIHEMLHNLGARFNGRPRHIPTALDRNGTVVHALLSGTYAGGSMDEVMARDYLEGTPAADLRPGAVTSGRYLGRHGQQRRGILELRNDEPQGRAERLRRLPEFLAVQPPVAGQPAAGTQHAPSRSGIRGGRQNWPYTSTATFSTTRSNGRTTPPCRSASKAFRSKRAGTMFCSR